MLESCCEELGSVVIPVNQGRQKYMHTFDTDTYRMAEGFEDYEPVVRALLHDAGFQGVAHMTVDEKVVMPGMSQRRPGAHVDGRFMAEAQNWSHPPGPGPLWAHYCNRVPVDRMSVIVASDVPGCIVYEGKFDGFPKNDGDLEHIREQLGDGKLLPANVGFRLSPDCVHESMIFQESTARVFLRVALEKGGGP